MRVALLSLLLFFFVIPHTLEDFAVGEPGNAGAPAPVLATVISTVVALQALGLLWIGQQRRRGLFVHAGVGLFWTFAAGMAQIPVILTTAPYRSGAISIFYVGGVVAIGSLLCIASLLALRAGSSAH